MKTANKILLTTDLSETSWAALDVARELAGALDAELHVATVIEEPYHLTEYVSGDEHVLRLLRETEPAVRARLADALKKRAPDLKATLHVFTSHLAAKEIVERAEALGADYLVMATHGRTGFGHLLLGSIAEKVVRTSPIPVVTVRAAALR